MRPAYYVNNGRQAIEVSRYMHGNAAQVYQYVFRAGRKDDGHSDLQKALTFLSDWEAHCEANTGPYWAAFDQAHKNHCVLVVGLGSHKIAALSDIFHAWAEGVDADFRSAREAILALKDILT